MPKLSSFMTGVQADMNVSLTAISLLWNAADLLSKLSSAPAAANGGPAPAVALDSTQFEELLRVLFVALQVLSLARHASARQG